jgi:16S rRNA (uracil1498-N3)-methyltransferase
MNRLHVPRNEIHGDTITVEGRSLAYLRDVLRMRPGEPLEIFDGEGRAYPSVLERYVDEGAEIRLGGVVERPFAGVRVTLAQGLPKGDKLELVLQKAVELGVTSFVPLACERSVVKLDPKKAAERVERWQRIADEAARQCLRADTVSVAPVQGLAAFVSTASRPNERRLILDEEERSTRLRSQLTDAGAHYVLIVGPEGGLSRNELETARRGGFVPVTLGPRVLRTETVGLAVLSVIQHVLGDLA